MTQDHSDPGASKGTDESTLGKESSVPLIHQDPSDLGSTHGNAPFDGTNIPSVSVRFYTPLSFILPSRIFFAFLMYREAKQVISVC